jgi:hypothetical protein
MIITSETDGIVKIGILTWSEVTLIVEEYRNGIECAVKSCAAINVRSFEDNFLPGCDAVWLGR